jgi:hypothetical protein
LACTKENEADGWTPIQAWALRQRAKGRSVLFIHHSGKTEAQRGTSRREDVLDTMIALKRPADYHPEQGAVFEVHFEKARGLYGDDVKPIEATLTTDIASKLGVGKSTISKHANRAKSTGLIEPQRKESWVYPTINWQKAGTRSHGGNGLALRHGVG